MISETKLALLGLIATVLLPAVFFPIVKVGLVALAIAAPTLFPSSLIALALFLSGLLIVINQETLLLFGLIL